MYSWALSSSRGICHAESELPLIGKIALAEGLIALNAGLAAAEPQVYGGVMIPATWLFAWSEKSSFGRQILINSLATGLFVFDIAVPEQNDYEWEKTFAINMVAMNAILGIDLLTGSSHSDKSREKQDQAKLLTGVVATPSGPMLSLVYRF